MGQAGMCGWSNQGVKTLLSIQGGNKLRKSYFLARSACAGVANFPFGSKIPLSPSRHQNNYCLRLDAAEFK
jgi:hypothetical protein